RRVVQSLVDKPLDAVARSARVEVTLIEQLERHLAGAGARVHDSGGWVVRWFGRSPARSSDRSCMHFGAQVHPTTEPRWRPAAPGSLRACPGRYGFLHKKGLAERLAPTGLAPVERGLCTRKRLRGPKPPPGSPRWSEGLNTRKPLPWCTSRRSTGASPV